MKYAPILELHLAHSFYTDGRCADFTIEPTAETAVLLGNFRCVMGTIPCGLRISTALDDSTGLPFLPLPSGTALRFQLRLSNSDFILFTDLSDPLWQTGPGTSIPLFSSASLAQGNTALTLGAGDTARTPEIFAQVEVRLDGKSVGASAPVCTVSFSARQQRWAYYCVTNLAAGGTELSIVDASPPGTVDTLLFSAANLTALDQNPDPSDPIGMQITSRYPGLRCVRMLSDGLVKCRQEPRKYLELRHGSDRLCGPLPNPSMRHASRMNANTPQDVLFQLIKYQSDPFSNP